MARPRLTTYRVSIALAMKQARLRGWAAPCRLVTGQRMCWLSWRPSNSESGRSFGSATVSAGSSSSSFCEPQQRSVTRRGNVSRTSPGRSCSSPPRTPVRGSRIMSDCWVVCCGARRPSETSARTMRTYASLPSGTAITPSGLRSIRGYSSRRRTRRACGSWTKPARTLASAASSPCGSTPIISRSASRLIGHPGLQKHPPIRRPICATQTNASNAFVCGCRRAQHRAHCRATTTILHLVSASRGR